MGDASLRPLRRTGRVERVTEQDEGGIRGTGLCRRETRDSTAE